MVRAAEAAGVHPQLGVPSGGGAGLHHAGAFFWRWIHDAREEGEEPEKSGRSYEARCLQSV